MAGDGWRTGRPLAERLYNNPQSFEFLKALELLERLAPEKDKAGESLRPGNEAARFVSDIELAFSGTEISRLEPTLTSEAAKLREEERLEQRKTKGAAKSKPLKLNEVNRDQPSEIAIAFMGLAGVNSPMPLPYAEMIRERAQRKDYAARDFLNLFMHRLTALYARGKRLHRVGLDGRAPGQDHLSKHFLSLMGLGTEGTQGRQSFSDRALLPVAAVMAQRPRSMAGLEVVLGHYFGVKVKGVSFIGRWTAIPEAHQTKLGTLGQNSRLGKNAVLGKRAWTQADTFELRLMNLTLKQYQDFLPGRPGFEALKELTWLYLGRKTDFFLRPELAKGQAPNLRLSENGAARLGWSAWLNTQSSDASAEETGVRVWTGDAVRGQAYG